MSADPAAETGPDPVAPTLAAVAEPSPLEQRLAVAAQEHDAALSRERDFEVQLAATREQRHQLFGRVQALRELVEEERATKAATPNRQARRAAARKK